jgi:hypothetical protein
VSAIDIHEHLMDAQIANARQAALIYNAATPEIDSAIERLLWIAKHSTGPIREQARAAISDLTTAYTENRTELGHVRGAAQAASGWNVKRAARELRPILSDLLNPLFGPAKRAELLTALHGIFEQCPARVLRSVSLAHELDNRRVTPRKTTLMLELLAAWEAGRAPK